MPNQKIINILQLMTKEKIDQYTKKENLLNIKQDAKIISFVTRKKIRENKLALNEFQVNLLEMYQVLKKPKVKGVLIDIKVE